MRIVVYGTKRPPKTDGPFPYVLLYQDPWNDFGIRSRFVAELRLADDRSLELGGVRIAVGTRGYRAEELPTTLTALPKGAVSMGESVAYYRLLGEEVPTRERNRYLRLMGDIVKRPGLREGLAGTDIWEKSFMREAASRHALARGGHHVQSEAELIPPPVFDFHMQMASAVEPHEFRVDFSAQAGIPHRTMLLVGPNGTGKTRCLAGLVSALIPGQALVPDTALPGATLSPNPEISRLITVSYNAFDEFPLPRIPARAPVPTGVARRSRHNYKYCGLRNADGEIRVAEVGKMLDDALGPVSASERDDVLRRVLSGLLGPRLAEAITDPDLRAEALKSLSAGQRLVAAIFTNIIGYVEEGSLILIDEPETHLHPGLLSNVVSALERILEDFDSYAIIATHSPFLLQQVPSQFVRVFRRLDDSPEIGTLQLESFGEDLGELNRLVLGLADPVDDFTTTLGSLHAREGSAEAVERLFAHPLGLPAKAHLYALDDDADASDTE